MAAYLEAETRGLSRDGCKLKPDGNDAFSRETSADDASDSAQRQETHAAAQLTSDSLSSWDGSDNEEEKVSDSAVYSRSMMLTIRLSLMKGESLLSGKEPLGISAKSKQLPAPVEAQLEAPVTGPTGEAPTTAMLRNLPNQCSRAMLVKWLCSTEFATDFDLVYVPVDRTSGNNLGYAFINFMEASSCQDFMRTIHGTKAAKCFPGSRSGKVLQCCYAKVQGKEPYCQGLANANRLPAPGNWGAAEFAASQLMGTDTYSLRADAPDFVPTMGAWYSAVEEAEREESANEPAVSSSAPACKGLRADAPDFVPGAQAAIMHADLFLEAFMGVPMGELSARSHAQAAARAKRFSSQLYVGPLGASSPPSASVDARQEHVEGAVQSQEETR